MNILDQQDKLKGLSEQQLVSEMQMPTGQMPQFLVLSEITRRKGLRDEMAAREQRGPQSTVAEEAVAAAGMPQQGLGRMAAAMAPKSDVVGNTGIASLPQAPQAMAEGGRVGGQTYDVPPTAYLRDPAVQALAARMGIRPAQMWDQMSEGQRASEVARLAAQDNDASGPTTREDFVAGLTQMGSGVNPSYDPVATEQGTRADFIMPSQGDMDRRFSETVVPRGFPPNLSPQPASTGFGVQLPSVQDTPGMSGAPQAPGGVIDLDLTGPAFEQQGRNPPASFPFNPDAVAMALGRTDFAPNMLQASQAGLEEDRAARSAFGKRSDEFALKLLTDPEARKDFGAKTDAAVGDFLFPGPDPAVAARLAEITAAAAPTGPDFERQGRDPKDNTPWFLKMDKDAAPGEAMERILFPGRDPAEIRRKRLANQTTGAPLDIPPEGADTLLPPAVTPDAAQTAAEETRAANEAAAAPTANPAIAAGAGGSGGSGGSGGGAAATGGMSSYEQELTNAITRGEKRAQQDKWLALAQAGMALMSSKEPTLGGALGEAGATGLAAFRGSRDSAEESRMKLLEQQFGVQMTRQQMAMAQARGARGGGGGSGIGGLTPLQLIKLQQEEQKTLLSEIEILGGMAGDFNLTEAQRMQATEAMRVRMDRAFGGASVAADPRDSMAIP